MKKLFMFLAISTLIVGCDAPQRTRILSSNSSTYTDPSTGNGSLGNTSNSTSGSNSGNSGSSNAVTSVPGFENCNIGDNYHNIDVGHFGLCQSTQDETLFKFRTSLGSSSSRICLIPTFKDATGSSTYLGSPQCTYTTANTIVTGKLYKDRSGYSNYALNGVIVMRETLTPSYFNCMNAYLNWPANACQISSNYQYCQYWRNQCPYGGGTTSGTPCSNAATSYMNSVCTSFKNTYANSYTDIRTK